MAVAGSCIKIQSQYEKLAIRKYALCSKNPNITPSHSCRGFEIVDQTPQVQLIELPSKQEQNINVSKREIS
jgi:hypothetical protein